MAFICFKNNIRSSRTSPDSALPSSELVKSATLRFCTRPQATSLQLTPATAQISSVPASFFLTRPDCPYGLYTKDGGKPLQRAAVGAAARLTIFSPAANELCHKGASAVAGFAHRNDTPSPCPKK